MALLACSPMMPSIMPIMPQGPEASQVALTCTVHASVAGVAVTREAVVYLLPPGIPSTGFEVTVSVPAGEKVACCCSVTGMELVPVCAGSDTVVRYSVQHQGR